MLDDREYNGSIEGRVFQLEKSRTHDREKLANFEKDQAVISTDIKHLSSATKDNTNALKELNGVLAKISDDLSYKKGVVIGAAKFAAFGTVVVGGLASFAAWVCGILHIGPVLKQ